MSAPQVDRPGSPQVVIVSGDDWEGLYVDGQLRCEDHHLSSHDILKALGVSYDYLGCDGDWLMYRGSLPEKIEDVKEYRRDPEPKREQSREVEDRLERSKRRRLYEW